MRSVIPYMKTYTFDINRPFHNHVVSYLALLHAIKVFPIFGLKGVSIEFNILPNIADGKLKTRFQKEMSDLKEKIKSLYGHPLELKITGELQTANFTMEEVAEKVTGDLQLLDFIIPCAHAVIANTYDYCLSNNYVNKDPIWQFFRHCRNAVSHGGKLYFKKGEPKYHTEWRGIRLTNNLHGLKLIKKGNDGLIETGDPVALLFDIENNYQNVV